MELGAAQQEAPWVPGGLTASWRSQVGDLRHLAAGQFPFRITQVAREEVEFHADRTAGIVGPRPDDVFSGRMKIRAPVDVIEVVGELHFRLTVD